MNRVALRVLIACLVAGCSAAPRSSDPAATAVPSPAAGASSSEVATASAESPAPSLAAGAPQVLPQHGTFTGELTTGSQTYPVVLWIDGCGHTEEVCGDLEVSDPAHPAFTLCAPQLVFKGTLGERDVFDENPAYRPDQCPVATLQVSAVPSSSPPAVVIEGATDAGQAPCCAGTLSQTSAAPPPDDPVPVLPSIDGLTGPLSAVGLGGPTTPYPAADSTRAYFPTQGELISVVLDTGQSDEMAYNGDVASTTDPAAVATIGDAIWVTRGPSKTLERVDVTPDAAATQPIALPHTPYALAVDGDTLWVTAPSDDAVMAVNSTTGELLASIDVPQPAGIAVGGGAVWVVERGADTLARIDPATHAITDEVPLGATGDDPACGMCAETVIYAFDSAWTANDLGRSITRVDGRTRTATTIPTVNRVGSVAAHGGAIYGSQFEEADGYIDRTVGGLVRIDPETNEVESLPAPGVRGVAALGEYLWLVVPGRRDDAVLRYR